MSSDSDSDSDQGVQVRVALKLASSVQDRSLEVPTEPIAVPADVGRNGLSAVLNHLLGRAVVKGKKKDDESDSDSDDDDDKDEDADKLPPLSFEFIMAGTNNRLLRKGVEKEARQHGVSLEEAISITYFPATSAPDLSDDKEQLPDWVGCLAYDAESSILSSGCYDGTLHLYEQQDGSLSKLQAVAVSSGPIKALASADIDDQLWIATSSLDHSLSVHTYTSDRGLEAFGQCVQEEQSSAISSLDFCKSASASKLLASGDGNGAIALWDLDQEAKDLDISATTKKQKTSSKSGQKASSSRQISSKVFMESAHSQLVSGLSWGNHANSNHTHLISGSWDHSIKLWDVERQDCLMTLNGSRVVSCLDTSYHSEGVVATGHPDCTLRLWDVRVNTSTTTVVSDTTFRPSHKAWVSAVRWSPSNAYHLASGSHDGTVKVWDIRSSNPLHTIRTFPNDEKALCLVWDAATEDSDSLQKIFAGGTDCIIKQLKF